MPAGVHVHSKARPQPRRMCQRFSGAALESNLESMMEHWLQRQGEERFELNENESRVVLRLCFLSLCDETPALAQLLAVEPEKFMRLASASFKQLCSEETVRFWVRPSIPPFRLDTPPGDTRRTQFFSGQILSLESPTHLRWSYTCICADTTCPGNTAPFVLTAMDSAELRAESNTRCPICTSPELIEDFTSRTFIQASTLLLSVHNKLDATEEGHSGGKVHRSLMVVAVHLLDDLSEVPLAVGQCIQVLAYTHGGGLDAFAAQVRSSPHPKTRCGAPGSAGLA